VLCQRRALRRSACEEGGEWQRGVSYGGEVHELVVAGVGCAGVVDLLAAGGCAGSRVFSVATTWGMSLVGVGCAGSEVF